MKNIKKRQHLRHFKRTINRLCRNLNIAIDDFKEDIDKCKEDMIINIDLNEKEMLIYKPIPEDVLKDLDMISKKIDINKIYKESNNK